MLRIISRACVFNPHLSESCYIKNERKMLRGVFNRLPLRSSIASPGLKKGVPFYKLNNSKSPYNFVSRSYAMYQASKADIELFDMKQFTPDKIRNFCIIAHIDHGKTTLSTKLLTSTNTISDNTKNAMYLDKLQVEKERGITVKAQTCTIVYPHSDGISYLINLIDTPGHVDFNYEVTRSLMACQGALLVVDASQGIQAQTLANFWLAFEQNLSILPVINKIDLPSAMVPIVTQQIKETFDVHPDDVLLISAKSGLGVDKVLPRVVEAVPPPTTTSDKPLKALLFDNWFDSFRGVVCLVNIREGKVQKGDRIVSAGTNKVYDVVEVGILNPENKPTDALYAGQVGYIFCGMKTTQEARVGDTFYMEGKPVEALPGFKPAKPMVFAGVYPMDSSDFENLKDAVQKLTLNDSSVPVEKESSEALGMGYRCGFLGMLHMDVFMQRLQQEYDAEVLATPPTVPYKVVLKDGTEKIVSNPAEYPQEEEIDHVEEPFVEAAIVAPNEYIGPILNLCTDRRGVPGSSTMMGERIRMMFTLPLSEVIVDFYDKLKQITSGYASFEYEDAGYDTSPLVKVHIMLNGENIDALSFIVHQSKSHQMGKTMVEKLKGVVEKQLFQIAIQAAIGSRVIARETVSAARKDVLAKCYGGDITRKRKLLDKQKEGKKKLKRIGNIELPPEAFLEMLKR